MNFPGLSPDARVWIYLSDREFTPAEVQRIQALLDAFTASWKSHGSPVKAYGQVILNRFIVLAGESPDGPIGGCAIDASVHLMKTIESEFGISLFNRQLVALNIDDKVTVIPLEHVPELLEKGKISRETPVFNTLVQTAGQFENEWVIPLGDSWINQLAAL